MLEVRDKGRAPYPRCGKCENCKKLERVMRRVLACCNPPFTHADQGVVGLWNQELSRLPCGQENNEEER